MARKSLVIGCGSLVLHAMDTSRGVERELSVSLDIDQHL